MSEVFNKDAILAKRDRFASVDACHYFLLNKIYELLLERFNGKFNDVLNLGAHRGELLNCLSFSKDTYFKDILHTDVSQAMLNCIKGKTIVADQENLPFKSERFDAVISAMTLHHVSDLKSSLLHILRVLKKNGLFVANIFGPKTLWELKKAILSAQKDTFFPSVSPFIDVKDAGRLLQKAGFAKPIATTEEIQVQYQSLMQLFLDLRATAQTNVLNAKSKNIIKQNMLKKISAEYQAVCQGKITATFEVVILMGWK